MIEETSSPQTPSTAIESEVAETFPVHPDPDREIPAIPQDFGGWGPVNPKRRRKRRG